MNLRFLSLVAAAALIAALLPSCTSGKSLPPLATAGPVDLQRYSGLWFEQFRLPNSFQNDEATAEARYTPQPDGSVRVVNTEIRPDGTRKTATGTATTVPGSRNSRLRVKFEGLAALVPAAKEGNYWIIRLAPDYSAALVGTPDRKFLWLLSRDRDLTAARRNEYVQEARRQGFDTSRLLDRPQQSQ
ncbi:MAG: lipocalin family protein [Verrucomicrobiota bacterium]